MHPDLFAPHQQTDAVAEAIKPWRPRALDHSSWPPDYRAVHAWRIKTLAELRADPRKLAGAHAYYAKNPADFIQHWMDTYNPRKQSNKWMPFVFFKRQEELVDFFMSLFRDGESGLVEKARDMGATWVACAISVWCLKYLQDDATGWGSRKQDLVDKLGDADSIFEKIRLIIRRLPPEFRPDWGTALMKIVNRENGAIIAGESGDNIGRGGRKSRYFKDEAQPLNAPVLTPGGWVKMGDLSVGDKVCGPDGTTRIVTHINDCGKHACYRITLVDGTTVTASEGHIWPVLNRNNHRKAMIARTVDLYENFIYKSPGGQTQYRFETLDSGIVEFDKQPDRLPLDPYIVGVLLGDGSVKQVPKYRPSFTSGDAEVADHVEAVLPPDCTITAAKDGKSYRLGDIEGRRGRFKVSRASQRIMAAGIAGYGAEDKHIPNLYKYRSVEERTSLLQGLMDTDGSASGGTLTYHTCSRKLADDVRFLVQTLGGRASLNTKPDHRGYRDMYCLHVVFGNGVVPFRLSRKVNAMKPRKQVWGRSIFNVEPIGEQDVRCITVDNPDGLYITENCIVTHNSAHYERPELIEAALGDNTEVQIDISSVNGLGNVFHRRRESGEVWYPGKNDISPGVPRVFIMDWRDHPEKDQEWYDRRKAKAEREGLQHIFAQEVDRNYSAAVENTIIAYEWIEAAVDAHLEIPIMAASAHSEEWMAGLDVYDAGADKNALTIRQGFVLRHAREWGDRDPGVATRYTLADLRERRLQGIKIQYDPIGIGSAVKSEWNRLVDTETVAWNEFELVPWHAGASVINPYERIIPGDDQTPLNRDMFDNFKAQAWWAVRTRFYKTWRLRQMIKEGRTDETYRPDELISIDSTIPCLHQLQKELAQPTMGKSAKSLKMLVEKAPNGTRSPNLGDATVQCFFPSNKAPVSMEMGSVSG